jgi:hypothetical protein
MVTARRSKPLKTTVGIPPTASDLGSELDVGGPGSDTSGADIAQLQNWTLNVRGFIRAPMRLSWGPRDDPGPGSELHSPPRMVGMSGNWSYIALAQNPSASLRTTISNPRVTGTLILSANTFSDVGYDDIDSLGGVTQGYVTLKFPDSFGSRGGLALTVGAFSHSYGTSGPRQSNTGYYGTYLFGRTHVVGEDLTANIDLTEHVELLLEHGFGAKLDLLPTLSGHLPKQMFIPGDPRSTLGSNYLHHAHVALWIDNWLKVAAHYLTSWTPNERMAATNVPVKEGRLSSTGLEVHLDHPRWGSGYAGYSHVWGSNLLPLDEALQVIHGGRGYDFKLVYFGNKLRQYGSSNFFSNDGGRVETVLVQYTLRSWEVFEYPGSRRSVNLSVYGMFSHVYSPPQYSDLRNVNGAPPLVGLFSINDNKLKYGSLLEFAAHRHISLNARFDRVQPTSSDTEQSYTALTGQLIIRSDWRSNRMILVGYTRYILGLHTYPDSPYGSLNRQTDPNLFVVSAIMSL